jgi:hypothetical protein
VDYTVDVILLDIGGDSSLITDYTISYHHVENIRCWVQANLQRLKIGTLVDSRLEQVQNLLQYVMYVRIHSDTAQDPTKTS